ncbi:MAG: hypothetical protein ACK5BM_06475, partial [Bacteroidota bacterium]
CSEGAEVCLIDDWAVRHKIVSYDTIKIKNLNLMANAKSNCFGARLCLPKIDSDCVNHQSF